MDKQSAKPSALAPAGAQGQGRSTSSDSNRLTKSEIEELRRDKRESLIYMQRKYFPNVKLVDGAQVLPER